MQSNVTLQLRPLSSADTDASVSNILENARHALGFIPNMYATMANAPALLKAYASSYEVFRRESHFSPVEQEVLFLTISRFHTCQYCMAAHSVIADSMSHVPVDVTDAIRNDEDIRHTKSAALNALTKVMLRSRGRPTARDVESFLQAGYTERHILDIIVAIAVKTLSNYGNHVLRPSVDDAFAGRAWNLPVRQ